LPRFCRSPRACYLLDAARRPIIYGQVPRAISPSLMSAQEEIGDCAADRRDMAYMLGPAAASRGLD